MIFGIKKELSVDAIKIIKKLRTNPLKY